MLKNAIYSCAMCRIPVATWQRDLPKSGSVTPWLLCSRCDMKSAARLRLYDARNQYWHLRAGLKGECNVTECYEAHYLPEYHPVTWLHDQAQRREE